MTALGISKGKRNKKKTQSQNLLKGLLKDIQATRGKVE
jgi:hypothetical protein